MQTIDNLKAVKAAGVRVQSYSTTETDRGVAWSCNLYLNGKKLGMVSNRGDGGMTHIEFSADEQSEVVALLKQHGYKLMLTYGELTVPEPEGNTDWLEFAVSQIGDELAEIKSYKRKMKTGIYFEKKTAPMFAFYKGVDTPNLRDQLKRHYGDDFVCFLNEEIAAL